MKRHCRYHREFKSGCHRCAGSSRSKKKREAARRNGKQGGRPRDEDGGPILHARRAKWRRAQAQRRARIRKKVLDNPIGL